VQKKPLDTVGAEKGSGYRVGVIFVAFDNTYVLWYLIFNCLRHLVDIMAGV